MDEIKKTADDKEINRSAPKSPVVPEQLSLDSKLKFRCHPGIECFTRCCNNIDIMLTPYDVLRMKNRLGIGSDEFLEKYTRSRIDERTGWPQLMILLNNDQTRSCPFVTQDGCSIYSDRPVMCRYYPVGQGIHRKQGANGPVNEEFYMLVREEHCLGFNEDREWTIREWRRDQDAEHYDEMNRDWKDLFIRSVSKSEEEDGRRQSIFFIASYNIDQFRRFVFESRFLEMFDVDDETLKNIRTDELELMQFAIKYLRFLNGVEKSMSVKESELPSTESDGDDESG